MSKFSLPALAGVSAIALSASAFAAPAASTVPNILIYALRTPTPINRIASSVTVITPEQIERENKPTVIELLRGVPGISIPNSGGVGQNTRVFMRGANSNHTLVVMDGVVLNDPSDPDTAFDFSNLTTDNVERIEVLRGPQSTLYGSQAIGGVINIITKKGRGVPSYQAFAEYGRYNSSKLGGGASGSIGKTSYSVTASNSHTNGISTFDRALGGQEKDGNNTYTFSGNVASKLTDEVTAKLNTRYNRSVTDFDSPGSVPNFGVRPDDDLFPNGDNRQVNVRAAIEFASPENDAWTHELGVSMLDFNRDLTTEYFPPPFFAPTFGRQHFRGRRHTLDWVHHLKLVAGHLFTVGGEASTESFAKTGLAQVDVDNQAFFADDQYNVTEDLFVNYGIRMDYHQSFGKEFTWKVAPGYNVKDTGTRLKATYGTGFKAPSLAQLNDPSSGNPNLNPEKSKGWDAGFEQSLWKDKASFGATFFRNNITDLIGFGPAPLFATLNVGKARTEGVESSVELRPAPQWALEANHTYTLAENRVRDTALLRRPKHLANASAVYQYSGDGDVGINVRYVGSSRDVYYASPTGAVISMNQFATIGLTTNYKVNPTVTLYGRVDNLLNKHYQEISGYGTPGMSLFVGSKANF